MATGENLEQGDLNWPQKTFVQQCLHAFFKVNGKYYGDAARADAAARGMSEGEYYTALWHDEPLRPYLGERPIFGVSPLAQVPEVPANADNRISYTVGALSPLNLVLLRAALVIEGGALTQLVSRIVTDHFRRYWESNYLPQIQLHQSRKFPGGNR